MRLFVGIPVPAGLALRSAAAQVARVPGAKPVPDGSWHVTLRFLGEVDDPGEVIDAVVAATYGHRTLQAVVEDLGTFPPGFPPDSRARVVWAGVRAHGLEKLARDIEEATADFGEPPERKPFVGHVTLARFAKPTDVRQVLADHRGALFHQGPLDQVVVYRSDLGPGGARHTPLHAVRLAP